METTSWAVAGAGDAVVEDQGALGRVGYADQDLDVLA